MEIIEPLRQIQKILACCFVNDENLSSLMIDQVHNPLFEKRLYTFRTGPSSVFPKKLIGEIEKLFHQEFIQGPTFFATQQYERRCVTCQNSLGQECLPLHCAFVHSICNVSSATGHQLCVSIVKVKVNSF